MAEVYVTKDGQEIGGAFGEALAKATGRGKTVSEGIFKTSTSQPVYGGGGGGSGGTTEAKKQLTARQREIQRYQKQGYSKEQASTLADYSLEKKQSPSLQEARRILYKDRGYSEQEAEYLSGRTSGKSLFSERSAEKLLAEKRRLEERQGFTGKVKKFEASKEEPEETRYFYKGTPVGRTFQRGGETYAEVRRPADFEFETRRGDTKITRETKLRREGITTTTQREVEATEREASKPINYIPPESFLKTVSAREAEFKQTTQAGVIDIRTGELTERSLRKNRKERLERLRRFDLKGTDFIVKYDKEKGLIRDTSSGKSINIALFDTAAKSFLTGTDILYAQLRLDKIESKLPKLFRKEFKASDVQRFTAENLKFAAFSPAMETSALLSRNLERQAQRATFEKLSQQQARTKQIALGTGEDDIIQIEAQRRLGKIKQDIQVQGKLVKSQQKGALGLEGDVYVVPKSDVLVTTRGTFDYVKSSPRGLIKESIGDIRTFDIGVKSVVGQEGKRSAAFSKIVQVDPVSGKGEVSFGFGVAKQRKAKAFFETGVADTKVKTPLGRIYETVGFKAQKLKRRGDIRRADLELVSKGVGKNIYYKIPKRDLGTKGFTGGGKKSSKRFLQQMFQQETKQQQDAQAISQSIVSGIKTPKPVKTKIPKPSGFSTQQYKTPSIYAGQGTYERTDAIQAISPQQTTKGATITSVRISQTPSLRIGQGIISQQKSRAGQRIKQNQLTRQRNLLKEKTITKQNVRTLQETRTSQKLRISQRPILRQKIIQRSPTSYFIPKIKITPRIPPTKPPIIKGIKTPSVSTKKKKKKKKASEIVVVPQGFTAKQLGIKKLRLT